MSDADYSRHWIVLPRRNDMRDNAKIITKEEAVKEWERFGRTVLGPFVLEDDAPAV